KIAKKRLKVDVAVRYVKRKNPTMVERLPIHPQRFPCDEMHWNGIRAERVDNKQIECARAFLLQGQACIAETDPHVRCAVLQEREVARVACRVGDGGVDFVERPVLSALGVRGECADAKPDHSDTWFGKGAVKRVECLTDRTRPVEICQRLPPARHVEALCAME